jgi:hypothetical protein
VPKTGSGTAQVATSGPQAVQTTGNESSNYIDIIDKQNQTIDIGKTYLSRFREGGPYSGAGPENLVKFHVAEGIHKLELSYELLPGNEERVPAFQVKDQNDNQVAYGSDFNLEDHRSKWPFAISPGSYTLFIYPKFVSGGHASEYTFSLRPSP